MADINETTELIIQKLNEEIFDPSDRDFIKKVGISLSEFNSEMKTLKLYRVAEIRIDDRRTARKVFRLEKFEAVVLSGGLIKYLDKIKEQISHKDEADIISLKKNKSDIRKNQVTLTIAIVTSVYTAIDIFARLLLGFDLTGFLFGMK